MKKLLLLSIIACTLFSCTKDENVLDRGKVTCTINNEAKTFTLLNSISEWGLTFANDTIEELGFTDLPFPLPTTLPVTYNSDTDTVVIGGYIVNNKNYGAFNLGDDISLGSFEITINKNEGSKVSGTFSMIAFNPDNMADSVVITNGIFTDIPPLP